ncbi:phage tail tape measure protein [Aureimonas sp. SK2]|uniref:phage tail tape measure protein n=1 Tax=Aureimonas sp. SK2 TaxID=3015992 RepID=UPI0024443DA1|nr:phage tail tape measure protein [Aureimonas sp. SK2]
MSISSTISALLQLTGLTQAAAGLVAFARKVKQAAGAVANAARAAGRALRHAFGPATQLMIRATAAALKKVSGALDRVTRAATRAGVRMAVTGAKFLAILAAIAVAGTAAGVAVAGVAGLGAGALVGGGSAAIAVNTVNNQQVAETETGASRENATGLSGAATTFGFEAGKAEAAVTSLRDKLRDAAAGGESAALFEKMGVEATDASGKVRDTVDVLKDLDLATKRLSAKDRTKAFADVFGDDGAQMQKFMDGGGAASIAAASERAKGFGAIATDADVKMVGEFKSAINDLVLSFRGLALAVSRHLMPGFTQTTKALAEWISKNREVFAKHFAGGWDRVMKSMRGAVGVLRIIPMMSGYVVRSMHTLLGVFADVGRYLAGDYISIERSWVYEVMRAIHATIAVLTTLVGSGGGGLVGALARGWVGFLSILTQVWAAFLGLDHVVQHGWIIVMRDGVMAIVGIVSKLPAYIAALPPQFDAAKAVVLAVVEVLKQAVIDSVAALLAFSQLSAEQAMALIEAKIAAFQARVAEFLRPIRQAFADVWEVLRDGDSAQVESPTIAKFKAELVLLRTAALRFWEAMKGAWEKFRGVLDWVIWATTPVRALLGMDPLQFALFLGLLRISGILNVMVTTIGLLITGFGRLFAMGMAGTLGAGIQGFLTGIVGSMTNLARMIPQIALLAGAAWAGAQVGKWAGQKFYEYSGMQARDDAEFNDALTNLRNSNNALHDRHLAALAAKPKAPEIPVRTGDALMSDGRTLDMDRIWELKRGGGSTDTVNVNFNVGSRTAAFQGTRSAVDDLNRALAEARTAGGLR